MTFHSILFDRTAPQPAGSTPVPACFADLNLDQLVSAVTAGREEYELGEFFYQPIHDPTLIGYRHEVVRDLQTPVLRGAIEEFATTMRQVREKLTQSDKLHYPYQKQSLFLVAAQLYSAAVARLSRDPALAEAPSKGFRDLHTFLEDYVESMAFTTLVADADHLHDSLAAVSYCVLLNGNRITVTRYAGQADYTAQVEATFEKFKQGAVKDYRVSIPDYLDMNHVEAGVLDLVARLYPDTFAALTKFFTTHRSFTDDTIVGFDRQVQFYTGYLHLIERLERDGLSFCLPTISPDSKNIRASGTFDLVLADKLAGTNGGVVTNDFSLSGPERILVVSGPNQGGKTTFARTFGQLHYLASLGLPVPGSSSELFLPDQIFTHFEREEDPTALRGKLEDDLVRIHTVLEEATDNSIVIMNELFSSTTLADAISLGTAVLASLIGRGCLGVCVTFVDELSRLGEATVSLVSAVDPDDPTTRTFKLERRPADGLSYAVTIAEKYGLTYARLAERIAG